jgi:ABC-type polysaccharide/polyol phosphate export permease
MSNRIYFPRAVLPLVAIVANLYSLAVMVVLLVAMAAVLGAPLGFALLWLVPAVLVLVALTASLSLLAAGLHVYFRDIRYIVQAVLTVWFYITPVVYPLSLAKGTLGTIVKWNPATGVIELFRAAVGAADRGWGSAVLVTCIWAVVASTVATYVHCRYNRVFVDLL